MDSGYKPARQLSRGVQIRRPRRGARFPQRQRVASELEKDAVHPIDDLLYALLSVYQPPDRHHHLAHAALRDDHARTARQGLERRAEDDIVRRRAERRPPRIILGAALLRDEAALEVLAREFDQPVP